jgi:hypothetical protein
MCVCVCVCVHVVFWTRFIVFRESEFEHNVAGVDMEDDDEKILHKLKFTAANYQGVIGCDNDVYPTDYTVTLDGIYSWYAYATLSNTVYCVILSQYI